MNDRSVVAGSCIVVGFVFGWPASTEAVHEPAGVVPVDPGRGRLLDVTEPGQRAGPAFRRLCDTAQIGPDAVTRPRIHDLRHTFAVSVLLAWYAADEDVEAQLPTLSTYLGHRDPRSTHWYLSAAPGLLALADDRLQLSRGVIAR